MRPVSLGAAPKNSEAAPNSLHFPQDGSSTPKCSESTPKSRKNPLVDELTDKGAPHAVG